MDPENQSNSQPIDNSPQTTAPEILPTGTNIESSPINQSTNQPVNSPPIVHEIPKRRNGFAIFVIVLLILTSLASLGYWAYKTYLVTSPIASPEPSAQAATPTATPDPTADWKVYTTQSLGISFKYPSTWSDPQEKLLQNQKEIIFEGELTIASQSGITLNQFVQKNLPTDKTPPTDYVNSDIQGKRLVYRSGTDQTTVDTVIVFPGEGQNVITFSYTDSPGHITKSETIDQILSTFKFLGTQTASPSAKPVACTQEAKLCPNGNYVGRTGPNCEFAPCGQ